jgi:hypothetical protein
MGAEEVGTPYEAGSGVRTGSCAETAVEADAMSVAGVTGAGVAKRVRGDR